MAVSAEIRQRAQMSELLVDPKILEEGRSLFKKPSTTEAFRFVKKL
jgi:hypothetical protein